MNNLLVSKEIKTEQTKTSQNHNKCYSHILAMVMAARILYCPDAFVILVVN